MQVLASRMSADPRRSVHWAQLPAHLQLVASGVKALVNAAIPSSIEADSIAHSTRIKKRPSAWS